MSSIDPSRLAETIGQRIEQCKPLMSTLVKGGIFH